jgi:hypothetical protein
MPHAHILVWLKDALDTPAKIDACICAEMPENPRLRKIVAEHMLHNDCVNSPGTAKCLREDGTCRFCYAKAFCVETILNDEYGRTQYRRRSAEDGGFEGYVGQGRNRRWLTNQYVILVLGSF